MEKAAAQRTKERGGEPVPALPSNLKIQNRKMQLRHWNISGEFTKTV